MLPRLIHKSPVTIQQADKDETEYDDDFREPFQDLARSDDVIVQGQIRWTREQSLRLEHAGAVLDVDGYVLFRYADLAAAGVTLKIGDRFSKLGTIDVDVYVIDLHPMGHTNAATSATLVRAYFKDRAPDKDNKGAL